MTERLTLSHHLKINYSCYAILIPLLKVFFQKIKKKRLKSYFGKIGDNLKDYLKKYILV